VMDGLMTGHSFSVRPMQLLEATQRSQTE